MPELERNLANAADQCRRRIDSLLSVVNALPRGGFFEYLSQESVTLARETRQLLKGKNDPKEVYKILFRAYVKAIDIMCRSQSLSQSGLQSAPIDVVSYADLLKVTVKEIKSEREFDEVIDIKALRKEALEDVGVLSEATVEQLKDVLPERVDVKPEVSIELRN